MNRTITINLASINFYIDEDAYTKLDKYLKAISASLEPENRKETMQDIEARIAELFLENRKKDTDVIQMEAIDKVIGVMGQPEDYQVGEDHFEEEPKAEQSVFSKKLYRDIDRRVIGGVCSGLSHYFGISVIWVRIIFLIFLVSGTVSALLMTSGSTVFLAYIILWIVVPAARTTSEKLDMRGEKIDIGNIERKVREEYDNIKNQVDNADYSQAENFFEKLGNFLLACLKVFVVIIGFLIVFIAGVSLIAILLSFLSLGAISIGGFFNPIDYNMGVYTHMPQWLTYILLLFLIGIPFLLMLFAGIKIISPRSKSIGLTGILVLIGLWILSMVPFIIYTPNWNWLSQHYINKTDTEELNISKKDTLYIQGFKIKENIGKHQMDLFRHRGKTYSKKVKLAIKPTKEKGHLDIKKSAKIIGWNEVNTDEIHYSNKFQNDSLFLDKLSSLNLDKEKVQYQHINSTLYLPDSISFKVSYDMADHVKNIKQAYINHYLFFKNGELKCMDCPNDKPKKDSLSTDKKNITDQESSDEDEWYQEN